MPNYAQSPEDLLIRAEEEQQLEAQERYSRKLTPQQVQVLVRLYLVDETYEQAVQELGLDINTVLKVENKAVETLRHNKRVWGNYFAQA